MHNSIDVLEHNSSHNTASEKRDSRKQKEYISQSKNILERPHNREETSILTWIYTLKYVNPSATLAAVNGIT